LNILCTLSARAIVDNSNEAICGLGLKHLNCLQGTRDICAKPMRKCLVYYALDHESTVSQKL